MGAPPLARVTVAAEAGRASWRFVIGDQFVVALPTDADETISAAVSALEHSRPSIETLVALLPIGGTQALESFAVLVAADPSDGDGVPLSGVVRGGIAVDVYSVGGSRRFTDRGIRPWLLADFRSVIAVVVQADGAPVPRQSEIALAAPTAIGLTSGSRLDWLPGTSAARMPTSEPAPSVPEPSPAAAPVSAPAPAPAPPPDQAFRPRAEPQTPSVEDTIIRPRRFDADTVIRPRRFDADTVILRRSAATGTPPRTPSTPPPVIESLRIEPAVAAPPLSEEPLRETPLDEASESAPVPTAEAAAPSSPAAPSIPAPAPPASAAVDRPAFAFSIGRGPAVALDAVYLIGRKPRLGRVPVAGEDVRLIAVPSPTLEVSSTHVELRTRGEAVVVTDLRSTNGTVVVPPRAGRIRLRPGESLVVIPGTAVHIGDDTIISISAAELTPERSPLPPTTRRPMT